MQVYIKAASKKALNEKLALNERIGATEYDMFSTNNCILNDLPTGTVVKVYDKMVGGNPYAKSYGVWNKEKNKIA
jgi:hypothetical protein